MSIEDAQMTKKCPRCLEVKDILEFHIARRQSGGRQARCKVCTSQRKRVYGKYKDLTEAQKQAHRESVRKFKKIEPRKTRARCLLYWAVRRGELKRQPCVRCGGKAQGHHEDYSKPLDVVWLCPKHHMQRHKEMREEGKQP